MTKEEVLRLKDAELSFWNDAFTVWRMLNEAQVAEAYERIIKMTDDEKYLLSTALDAEEERRVLRDQDILVKMAEADMLTDGVLLIRSAPRS